jgi:phospholipid/cholesterol/gamma-HCH transport system permease protein
MENKSSKERYIALEKDFIYRFQDNTLYLSKSLLLPQTIWLTKKIPKEIRSFKVRNVILNLDELQDIDSAGVMALFHLKDILKKSGISVRIEGGSQPILDKIELFSPGRLPVHETPEKAGFMERTGDVVARFFTEFVFGFFTLAADIFYWSVADVFRSRSRRKGEVSNQAVLIGVNAALIVVFMSFVIGLVIALQSSGQLRNFGANIYIVDLTVISMMSQMGPLITAILVAGRSGSSIAAEIATMKVTAELNALKTMGLNPIRFVVVPKLYACLITMPFLIILANVSGILGGGVAAYIYLDITPEIFTNRMAGVMQNKDLITGFVKSQVYASLIVLTGSFFGFRVVRGAEGVGKVTTTAVVVAISLVIIADSILGLLFY